MMRDLAMTVMRGGIDRTRSRGGARADSLYDLLNGYLTEDGTVVVRDGTFRRAVLDAKTRGLAYFQDSLHVFCAEVVSVPGGYTLHVLVNPSQDPGEAVVPLKKIHFAQPFLGYLYVVAEFDTGEVFHYWLQGAASWEANKVYQIGDVVFPTTPNGLAYQANRTGAANPLWTANTPRTIGDVVEPTPANTNGFFYTVIDTSGANPASGDIEPNWPAQDGATVVESTDITPATTDTDAADPLTLVGSDVTDRYG